jgi:hypothetical protein
MSVYDLPQKAQGALFSDTILRDRVSARRTYLASILWRERFLTREQLIKRVEGELGKGCFGHHAWEDTFFRDMRAVKRALNAAGYQVVYSRNSQKQGYHLRDQPALAEELVGVLDGSIAEIDQEQITILHGLSPAERFHQGCSISDTARQAVAYRIHKANPDLSFEEANRLALLQGKRDE